MINNRKGLTRGNGTGRGGGGRGIQMARGIMRSGMVSDPCPPGHILCSDGYTCINPVLYEQCPTGPLQRKNPYM